MTNYQVQRVWWEKLGMKIKQFEKEYNSTIKIIKIPCKIETFDNCEDKINEFSFNQTKSYGNFTTEFLAKMYCLQNGSKMIEKMTNIPIFFLN